MPDHHPDSKLKKVEDYWNENLCGSHFIPEEYPSKEFFEQYRKFRQKKAHHLDRLIKWESARDKDVLEIGLGIGADAARWAAWAKSFTGIDLTMKSVEATRLHFKYLNLKGNVYQGDTENLSLRDDSFDIVYSHGVLHHTPDIQRAFKEIHRVLKSDGRLILMLYAKESFNYWIRIQTYMRLRLIGEILKNKLRMNNPELWARHIRNLKSRGWSYLSWKKFPHRCTDGPDCEIANIFSKKKIVRMLREGGFQIERMTKAHFPIRMNPQGESRLAKYLGFHRFIWARKAQSFSSKS